MHGWRKYLIYYYRAKVEGKGEHKVSSKMEMR